MCSINKVKVFTKWTLNRNIYDAEVNTASAMTHFMCLMTILQAGGLQYLAYLVSVYLTHLKNPNSSMVSWLLPDFQFSSKEASNKLQ